MKTALYRASEPSSSGSRTGRLIPITSGSGGSDPWVRISSGTRLSSTRGKSWCSSRINSHKSRGRTDICWRRYPQQWGRRVSGNPTSRGWGGLWMLLSEEGSCKVSRWRMRGCWSGFRIRNRITIQRNWSRIGRNRRKLLKILPSTLLSSGPTTAGGPRDDPFQCTSMSLILRGVVLWVGRSRWSGREHWRVRVLW